MTDLERAHEALKELQAYNPLHHDSDAYLLEVAKWGKGDIPHKPNPENFGIKKF